MQAGTRTLLADVCIGATNHLSGPAVHGTCLRQSMGAALAVPLAVGAAAWLFGKKGKRRSVQEEQKIRIEGECSFICVHHASCIRGVQWRVLCVAD
jgi:hypothetical protein